MGVLRLVGGSEVNVMDLADPRYYPDDETATELLKRVQERVIREAREEKIGQFMEAAVKTVPDITQYELVEEWDRDNRRIRWYFRRK